jgi:predicted RNA binding protein YcfA (HicA-like mRNA interferase family)
VLLRAALVLSLVLGVAVMVMNHERARAVEAREHPVDTLDDGAAAALVVSAAVDVVAAAGLRQPAGGYAFLSCTNSSDPPYQVAAYLTSVLPQVNSVGYFDDVASALRADGWSETGTSGEHFDTKLTKSGVTTVVYRNSERTDLATIRIYGECRVMTEHRNDDPVWTELTARLRRPG